MARKKRVGLLVVGLVFLGLTGGAVYMVMDRGEYLAGTQRAHDHAVRGANESLAAAKGAKGEQQAYELRRAQQQVEYLPQSKKYVDDARQIRNMWVGGIGVFALLAATFVTLGLRGKRAS